MNRMINFFFLIYIYFSYIYIKKNVHKCFVSFLNSAILDNFCLWVSLKSTFQIYLSTHKRSGHGLVQAGGQEEGEWCYFYVKNQFGFLILLIWSIKSNIRLQDFRLSSVVCHAQATPPGFWNVVDWRAPVEYKFPQMAIL